jgi:hypothetical protein
MTTTYFVLADFGRLGLEWVARDPRDATWQRTIQALANREWNKPVQVVEVDMARSTSADVTEKALLAARLLAQGAPARIFVDSLRAL